MDFSPYLNIAGSMWLLLTAMLPFELLWPAEAGQPLAKRLFNLAYMTIFLFVSICVITPVANLAYGNLLAATGGGLLPELVGPQNGIAGHVAFGFAFALAWDLWQYWVHRLQHSQPFFWETHKFHHSETALNATSQSRTHLSQYVLYLILYLPVFLLFGSQSPHFAAVFVMFRIWGVVNHANLRLSFGRLTPIISGPQWHRIHHSAAHRHRDKNFATFFPVIDMLFGTYYRPLPNEFPATGLADADAGGDLWEATFAPFQGWRDALSAPARTKAEPEARADLPLRVSRWFR